MKSALSLTLIVCLVASALPVTAQEKDPLARAITIEAVRLAAAGETTSSSVDAVQPGGTIARSDWSRVLNVAPGTEVIVTVRGSQPGTRYVVRADETQLTVLNLNDLFLPSDARRLLLNMASRRPEYLTDPRKAGVFIEKDVRVGPDGVFVADRKVADLGQVVERIARDEVVDFRLVRVGGSVARSAVWATLGFFGGAMAGGAIGGGMDAGLGGKGLGGAVVGMVVGAPVGIIWGGIHGYQAGSHQAEDVIYHAP